MKKLELRLTVAMFFLFVLINQLLSGSPVYATSNVTNAIYYGTIRAINNSTLASNITSNITNISTTSLINGSYITAANTTNLVLRNASGTDVAFMPGSGTSAWMMFVDTIPAGAIQDYTLYTGNVTDGSIRYFPAAGGMTIAYAANMAPGSNFQIDIRGYWDLSTVGANIIRKTGSIRVYVTAANQISVDYYNGGFITVTQVMNGCANGEHTLSLVANGATFKAYWDAEEKDSDAVVAVDYPASAWEYFITQPALVYMEYMKHYVSTNLKAHIAWNYDAAAPYEFTDLSPVANHAVPTFAVNSSDADVSASLVSFGPTEEATAPYSAVTSTTPDWVIAPNLTTSFRETVTPTAPGASIITAISAASATPSQLVFFLLAGFIILVISLVLTYAMKQSSGYTSFMVKAIAMGGMMGIAVATSLFDWWMPILWAIPVIAMGFASKPTGVV
jgi:hypothetical protein